VGAHTLLGGQSLLVAHTVIFSSAHEVVAQLAVKMSLGE